MKAYYAHCISIYGSPLETDDIEAIDSLGLDVVNPNEPQHDAGYTKNGMDYFKNLVRKCDVLFFRAMADGRISAGVATEIDTAAGSGLQVFELPSRIKTRIATIEETREFIYESGART